MSVFSRWAAISLVPFLFGGCASTPEQPSKPASQAQSLQQQVQKWLQQAEDATIEHLLLDSRKTLFPASSLFFALKGARRDGHHFLQEVYTKGVRHFIADNESLVDLPADAAVIVVKDSLQALQRLAAHHRKLFSYPVIGITGSNGKTIVKEWLSQLLEEKYNIVKSPKSYNSQIGVPLSVWQMNDTNTLALFEAGISQSGEMDKLEKVIQPTIGIFTNIGEAHSEGFLNQRQKVKEKLALRQPDFLVKQMQRFRFAFQMQILRGILQIQFDLRAFDNLAITVRQLCQPILERATQSNKGNVRQFNPRLRRRDLSDFTIPRFIAKQLRLRRRVIKLRVILKRFINQDVRKSVLPSPEQLHGIGEKNSHSLAPTRRRSVYARIAVTGQRTHNFANAVSNPIVFFIKPNVIKRPPVGSLHGTDRSMIETNAGRLNPEITTKGKELSLLRIKQTFEQFVLPRQGSNDANLIHVLATLLRQSIERFGNDLRRQPRDAQ